MRVKKEYLGDTPFTTLYRVSQKGYLGNTNSLDLRLPRLSPYRHSGNKSGQTQF